MSQQQERLDAGTDTDSNGRRCSSGREAGSRDSCVPHFDALWFCYTPGYQLRQFYRYGNVSDCQEYWSAFYNCLKKRTAYAHTVPAEAEALKPMWRLRTRQEAEAFWESEFGHIRRGEGAEQTQEQQQEQHVGAQHHSFVASLKQQGPSPALLAATAALAKGASPSPEQGQIRPTTASGETC